MGTSRAARAPSTVRWNDVVGALTAPERDSDFIVNTTLSIAIKTISNTHIIGNPIFYGIQEGVGFLNSIQNVGLVNTLSNYKIKVPEKYIVPKISNSLWNILTEKDVKNFTISSFGRLSEKAFKTTINQILIKGKDAFLKDIIKETYNISDIERNIKNFLRDYNSKGFLELLISNYFYEIILYYLHSEKNPTTHYEGANYRYYIDRNERGIKYHDIEIFNNNIRESCIIISKNIVSNIIKHNIFEGITEEKNISEYMEIFNTIIEKLEDSSYD